MLQTTIQSYIDLNDVLYESFLAIATRKQVTKNQIIFSPGKMNKKMMFLESGLMRAYRIINGQEYTHYFFLENWFATDFKSYLTEEVSDLYIETLTDVSYYEFPKAALIDFFDQYPAFEKLGRIIAEQAYLRMVERLVDFQTNNLKERYLRLISHNPQLFQKVPQKMIASYLGVAEQSLSRIKANRS